MTDILKSTFSNERSPTGNMSTNDFLSLIQHWKSLLPGLIAENSVPFRIKGKELQIATTHPALAQELSYMERDILLKILKHYPKWASKLDKLVFRYNPKFNIKSFITDLENYRVTRPSKIVIETNELSSLSLDQKLTLKNSTFDIMDEDIRKLLNSLIDKL